MGDVGDYWREAKKARKRPNPHKAAKAAATK